MLVPRERLRVGDAELRLVIRRARADDVEITAE
ncbi:hypothetical protein JOD60_000866 [Microbacterium aurum]|nr:hypothetical protein [Microbacterium aurum]